MEKQIQCVSLFSLPPNFAVEVSSEAPTLRDDLEKEPATRVPDASKMTASTSTFCTTCAVDMVERDAFRAHFRSDWHLANVQRKRRGDGPLTEDEFEDIFESWGALLPLTPQSPQLRAFPPQKIPTLTLPPLRKRSFVRPSTPLPPTWPNTPPAFAASAPALLFASAPQLASSGVPSGRPKPLRRMQP